MGKTSPKPFTSLTIFSHSDTFTHSTKKQTNKVVLEINIIFRTSKLIFSNKQPSLFFLNNNNPFSQNPFSPKKLPKFPFLRLIMNIQPKIEPGSSSSINHMILDRDEEEGLETQNLEDKNISDLIEVLRGAYKTEDFDRVEGVLMGRDVELRNQIQQLQHNVEMEKQQLQQELEMEKLARLQAEEDFKLREEDSKKVKKVQERYEALLKKVKITDSVTGTGTVEVLRKRNIELREMLEKGKREKESYEAQLKKAEIIGLADRDTIGELTKKNVELDCQVKKLKEDGNVVDVLRKKNAELEREVLELNGKRVEEENVVDVLRKKNAELERQVLELNEKRKVVDVLRKKNAELEHDVFELKEKRVEDGKTVDVVKAKNCELESEVCELRKLKEKWVDDSNSVVVLNKMNGELELEVSELKGKWIVDSNTVDELRRKVRVLENDKKGLAGILIKNIELKETISELRSENVKLADEKRKVEDLLESLNTKFRGLNERVARLEEDSKVLMSVNTSGGGNNEGEPPADPMVVASEEKDEDDGRDSEFGNDAVEEVAPVQRNEDAHHSHGVTSSTQVQNHGSREASLQSEVKGASSDDEDVDQCMSRGVHEKKAISGIALKNDHPTPCSSIAVQQITKFENEVDKVKRKFSLTDSESSTSSSSYDLSYFDDLTIKPVVSQAKKKKM